MPGRLPTMQLFLIGTVGASLQMGEILLLCGFFDCPSISFFLGDAPRVEPLNRFSRFMAQTTCFCVRRCLLGVRTMVDVIWGNMPQNTPKMALTRQFQAKTQKYKKRNISDIINPIKIKIEYQAETNSGTSWVVWYFPNPIWRPAAILKSRHDVITPPPIVGLLRNCQVDAKLHADNYT